LRQSRTDSAHFSDKFSRIMECWNMEGGTDGSRWEMTKH